MDTADKEAPRPRYKKWLYGTLGVLAGGIVLSAALDTKSPAPVSQIQEVAITDEECKPLLSEFYYASTGKGEAVPTTQKGKELFEQYLVDAGVSVSKSNPTVHYSLPDTTCGRSLGGLMALTAESVKKQ
jgi:hypothetical protein